MRLELIFDELPVSHNQYLRPSGQIKGGKVFAHMYETREAKDWKKRFGAYVGREVRKQGWDIEATKNGQWILKCVFVQARTNQDNANFYKCLLDSMTGIAFKDDKNILVRTERVLYDSKNPRFVAVLEKASHIGIFNNQIEYELFKTNNCDSCKKKTDSCQLLKKAFEGKLQSELNSIDCSKVKR